MNQLSMEPIKNFNVNELKSGLMKQGLAVPGKKEELFKRLTYAVQENIGDKQLSVNLNNFF